MDQDKRISKQQEQVDNEIDRLTNSYNELSIQNLVKSVDISGIHFYAIAILPNEKGEAYVVQNEQPPELESDVGIQSEKEKQALQNEQPPELESDVGMQSEKEKQAYQISFPDNFSPLPDQDFKLPKQSDMGLLRKAIHLLQDQEVKSLICPALSTLSEDAKEISKTLVPVLAGSAAVGIASVVFTPTIIAWVCILVVRMGIATVCGESTEEKKQ